MSDSQSHSISQEEIIYEEQQVLWAKIRGYPWWPAFVDKVHQNKNGNEEMQYTVFFFGDNTHSRLGGSKLRRFLDYYTEFFPKAKTNRKLYLSIMKAQEKLKQNGGNVEIFESLRNSLKKNKKHIGRLHNKTESKIDSQEHHQNVSQQPQLGTNLFYKFPIVRNKTFPHHDLKQSKQQNASQQQSSQKPTIRRRGRRSRKQIEQQQKQSLQKKQKPEQQEQQQPESMQQEKVQKQQDNQQLEQPLLLNYRTRSGRNKLTQNVGAMIDEKEEKVEHQKNQQQEDDSQSNQVQQPAKKTNYPLRFSNKTKTITRGGPKKRGRPKKVVEENNHQSQSQESQQQQNSKSANENNNKNIPNLARAQSSTQNRKTRTERNQQLSRLSLSNRLSERQKPNTAQQQHPHQQKPETSQQTKQLILERVKFCLDKRNQLIEYLDQLIITTDIVQEILDLGVSTVILQGGDHSAESIRVLHKLRSALQHKYFPKDIKIKKKYEKLSKKANSSKTNSPQNQESLQDLDLRKKTLIKLQKILKNVEQNEDQKNRAIEIESHFRKYDETIGNGYKTMAYKVLRALKDKIVSPQQMMSKLQAGDFDEQEK